MKFSFKKRMMVSILMIAGIAMGIIEIISYWNIKQNMVSSYEQSVKDKLQLQAERFDEMMQNMYLNVKEAGYDEALKYQIQNYIYGQEDYKTEMKLTQILSEKAEKSDVDSVLYLYIPKVNKVLSSLSYYAEKDVAAGADLNWDTGNAFAPNMYKSSLAQKGQYVYAYSQPIQNASGEVIGIICMEADERMIYYKLLDTLNAQQGETYMILKNDGTVCSAQAASDSGSQMELPEDLLVKRVGTGMGTDEFMYISAEAPFSQYYLVCQSDFRALTGSLRRQMIVIMISFVCILILIYAAAEIMSRRLYQPLNQLIHAIDQVGGGDFSARTDGQIDEFRAVSEHFNTMVSQMDGLMEQLVKEQMQKKEAEINALQYQIRPHFMYNTLNSIRFSAELQGNEKIAQLLGDFINLLEASVQRNGAFIPLKDEIQLVESFLSLQTFRYCNCFDTVYDISDEAEECFVPCLLLQPMVENAVFHGINTETKDNLISITAWIEQDTLYITVEDDGEGFETQSEESKERGEKRRLTGIGMQNVKQRLHLYYGDKADYTIRSVKGEGTTITFHLPVSKDPEEYQI